jgi:hypothetical protein
VTARATLCDRVRAELPEIRLCCPRGHFLVAVTLSAAVVNSTPILAMVPAVGRHHAWSRRLVGDRPERAGNRSFVVAAGPQRLGRSGDPLGRTVTLTCKRCPRWAPKPRDYQRLAAELAVPALAGHPDHRMAC